MEAEVHGDSEKALHYVESEVESSLWGKVGSLSNASNAVPNFCAFALEDSFYLCDKFGELNIVLQLVGKENIISVFPSLVSLCGKLPSTSGLSTFQMPAASQAMNLAFMVSWAVAWAVIHCVASRMERHWNFWATSVQSSWHSATN